MSSRRKQQTASRRGACTVGPFSLLLPHQALQLLSHRNATADHMRGPLPAERGRRPADLATPREEAARLCQVNHWQPTLRQLARHQLTHSWQAVLDRRGRRHLLLLHALDHRLARSFEAIQLRLPPGFRLSPLALSFRNSLILDARFFYQTALLSSTPLFQPPCLCLSVLFLERRYHTLLRHHLLCLATASLPKLSHGCAAFQRDDFLHQVFERLHLSPCCAIGLPESIALDKVSCCLLLHRFQRIGSQRVQLVDRQVVDRSIGQIFDHA